MGTIKDGKELLELEARYAAICMDEKRIAAEKEEVKKEIESRLPQESLDIKTEFGTFKMVAQPKWTFSDNVKTAEEDVKILKENEKEQGIATCEITYGLRFNAPKAK